MKRFKLYWKISLTLLGLMIVLGVGYLLITGFIGRQYFKEVNQKLYGTIADSTVMMIKFMDNGHVDTSEMQHLMHSMMIINPNVEVYLLNKQGGIVTYVAPYKRVKLKSVDLDPVLKFIAAKEKPYMEGDDPRYPGEKKVFSAAPVKDNGQLAGYLYIILASEEQAAITSMLSGSYFLKLGANLFFITLIAALMIGLLAFWLLTQNLRKLIDTVRRFKEGDYQARIVHADKSDLSDLANNFNDMADTIVGNIDELKSVENLRRELIANVSHDLRTPLAIMQGYVETLMLKENQIDPADRKKYLQTVHDSGNKLSKLIAQLFEYSKFEARQIQAKKEPFFIAELAQDIFQKYQLLAKEKGIHMHLNAKSDLPMVFADIGLVERVIQNLMDNALKFTPEGGEVTIALAGKDKSVEVRIADTGPGISMEEQAIIFERYRKVGRKEGKSKGAGLGLAIAQKILELHNASIKVQSKLNEGTTFIFRLPSYVEVV